MIDIKVRYKSITARASVLLGFTIAAGAAITTSLPATAQLRPYRFVSGKESIQLDVNAFNSLEDIGLSLSVVENLVTPATGYDFAWPVIPPAATPGDRGTNFEFLFDENTDTFVPISGTIEFGGSFFFELDPTKFSLESPLEIGELSVFFDENFEFFAIDTATTDLPIMSVNTFEAPTINLENQTWFLEPIELVFTSEFSDFLIDSAVTQETASQVANLVPGLKVGEARGDRGFISLDAAPIPEPSSMLSILVTTGIALVAKKRVS